jgi:hypothetical protein
MNENLPFALCRFFVICAVIPGLEHPNLKCRTEFASLLITLAEVEKLVQTHHVEILDEESDLVLVQFSPQVLPGRV